MESDLQKSVRRLTAIFRKSFAQLTVVWLCSLLFLIATVGPPVRRSIALPRTVPSWVNSDIDTGLIMEGLRNTKSSQDTLKWWSGPWVGIVPFYRPLTSYLFWFEWKAFDVDEPAYLYPTVALHVAASLVFAAFAWYLARWLRHPWPVAAGVVTAAVFSGVPGTPRIAVTSLVYLLWKNQPDAAATFFGVGALWMYLLSIQGRRGALAGAMGLYLIACGFKEIAVPLPVICLALEPDLRFWRRPALDRLFAMGATGVLFLVIRFLALGGMGYTYGSNGSVVSRSAVALLGPFGGLVSGNWLVPVSVIGSAVIIYLAYRRCCRCSEEDDSIRVPASRKWVTWFLWAGGWLVVLGWLGALDIVLDGAFDRHQVLTPEGWSTGLFHLGYTARMNNFHLMVLALGILVFLAVHSRRLLGIGFAWVVVMILPLTLSPGPLHRYYLPEAGYALIGGLGLSWLPLLLRRRSEPVKAHDQR